MMLNIGQMPTYVINAPGISESIIYPTSSLLVSIITPAVPTIGHAVLSWKNDQIYPQPVYILYDRTACPIVRDQRPKSAIVPEVQQLFLGFSGSHER